MYAVTEQGDATEDPRMWAEFEDGLVVLHRTKAGAEAALASVATAMGCPEGRDPGIWGNIAVHEVRRRPSYAVERD